MKLLKQFITLVSLLSVYGSMAQVRAKALVDHLKSDEFDNSGNIVLTVSGGTSPYTYSWSPGSFTNKDMTFASVGAYTVKITDNASNNISYYYNLGYKANWMSHYGTFLRNDSLIKKTSGGFTYNTAWTNNTLLRNVNGWAEYVIPAWTSHNLVGFIDSTDTYYDGWIDDIDFGFHITTGNTLYAWAGGGFTYIGTANEGDVLRLERIGNAYFYRLNGALQYSVSTNSNNKLKLKAMIMDQPLVNVGLSFADSSSLYRLRHINLAIDHVDPDGLDSLGNINSRITSGTYPYTYSWSPSGSTDRNLMEVKANSYTLKIKDGDNDSLRTTVNLGYKTAWRDFWGASAVKDTLISNAATTPSGSPSAFSINELRPNQSGWIQYVVEPFGSPYVIGFADTLLAGYRGSMDDINFALHISYGYALYGWNGSWNYLGTTKPGDVLKLEKNGSSFALKNNDSSIFVHSAVNSRNYKIKALLNDYIRLGSIGASFADSTTSNSFKAVAIIDHIKNLAMDTKGNIIMGMRGGSSPYTYTWQPGNTHNRHLYDVSAGSYTLTTRDYNGTTLNYVYSIGQKAEWTDFYRTEARNDSIMPDGTPPGGGGGYDFPTARTGNELHKNTNGWAEMVVRPMVSPYVVGFLDSASVAGPLDPFDMDFAYHLSTGNALYAFDGTNFYYVGSADEGDAVGIKRIGSVFHLTKNGVSTFTLPALAHKALKLKAQFNDAGICNIGLSCAPKLEVDYYKGDITNDEPNSGYIYLEPKNGIPPYRFKWNDNSTGNQVADLGPGTYSVMVIDTLRKDTVRLSFNIGEKVRFENTYNMSLNHGKFVKTNIEKPAVGISSLYLKENEDGFYEFKIPDVNTNFNFVLRPFDPDTNQSNPHVPIIKTTTISVLRSSLPSPGTSGYSDINFADTITTGTHANVIKKEYVDYNCTSSCSTLNMSGIHFDYGNVYTLIDGYTIKKATLVGNGDVLTIKKISGNLKVYNNGSQISSNGYSLGDEVIGTMVLIAPEVTLENFGIGGTAVNFNPYLDPCRKSPVDNTRNWIHTITYDGNGIRVAETRQYMDYMGKITQVQARNLAENVIMASQVLYDAYGRKVGTTLLAPIGQSCFFFKTDFIQDPSGGAYTYNDFDVPDYTASSSALTLGEADKPYAVKNTVANTLGWYYSNNNTYETHVASVSTPYSRIHYSTVDPSSIFKTSKPGKSLGSGSGHERYNFKMITAGELNSVFGNGYGWRIDDIHNFTSTDQCEEDVIVPAPLLDKTVLTLKTISVDENGLEAVTFRDMQGNIIANCLSGKVNGNNVKMQTCESYMSFTQETLGYVDFHLPDGCENTFQISYNAPITPSGNAPIFNFLNLKTGQFVIFGSSIDFTGTTPNLSPGCYRMMVKYIPPSHNGVSVIYGLNYYNFNLNYFDYANRLKATVSPKSQDGGYTYTGDPNYNPARTSMTIIPTTANDPLNFPPDTSWSLSSSAFSNTLNLNLRGIPANAFKNVKLFVDFSGKYEEGIGIDTTTGVGPSDARAFADSTAMGDYCAVKYTQEDTVFASPPNGGLGCDITEIYFHVKIAILDMNDSIIDGTEQESNSLRCVISSCGGSTYKTWEPIQFDYNTFYEPVGSARAQTWKKLKILEFNPIEGTYGGKNFPDLMSVVDLLKITVNAVDVAGNDLPQYPMVDRYRYNSLSQLLNTNQVDKGITDYVYADDGVLKFVQNAKQDASNSTAIYRKFDYMDYDHRHRPILSAEYNPHSSAWMHFYFENYQEKAANTNPPPPGQCSVHQIFNVNNGPILSPLSTDMNYHSYDRPDLNFYAETGLSPSNYVQKHLCGEISTSYNSVKKTWYSYDEQGAIEWIVQKYYNVNAVGDPDENMIKTFNYEYDHLGNITKVVYNKEEPDDRFWHYYEYDQDKQLRRVYTGRTSTEKILQTTYKFYLHGPLKRTEIANKLQAVDYVYTINGWLKGMNGPEMSKDYDPGKDGYLVENMTNTAYKDIFGMNLDYYLDDYEREATRIQSYDESQNSSIVFAPDLFNGIIKGMRWQTRTPSTQTGLSYPNQHLMYGYRYDKKYQLKEANFATITGNSTQNRPITETGSPTLLSTSISSDYRVYNLNYDYNGNILSLIRKAYSANANGANLDNLSYNYVSCSNKLNYVGDAVSTNPYNTLGLNPGQSSNNYLYNAIGEMTLDVNEGKKYYYNSNGNITEVLDGLNNMIAQYTYDAEGHRTMKIHWLSNGNKEFTWYVRDHDGNIITTFQKTSTATNIPYNNLNFGEPTEWNVYSGGRIGVLDNTSSNENYIYELSDHLGNVHATFKIQTKTSISNNFDGTGDDNWFMAKAAGGAFASLAPPFNNGTSVKTQQPNYAFGSGSRFIPVKNGDNVTIAWKNFFTTTSAPSGGMVVQLTDAAGNILPGCWQLIGNSGTPSNWNNQSTTYAVTANYPDMYLSFFPWNLDMGGAIVYYDDMSLTFNTGSVNQPDQLNMATYYPHGSIMPGMNYNSSFGYRYGYQGQFAEKNNETNEIFFELRNYDPLLARFKTTDPYGQYYSPYVAMSNSHPNLVDKNGGLATTWVCAIVGASAGFLITAAIDYWGEGPDNAKHKIDLNPLWYVGASSAGFLIGGIGGGLYDSFITRPGAQNFGKSGVPHNYLGLQVAFQQHSGGLYVEQFSRLWSKIRGIRLPTLKLPNLKLPNFSFAFRIGNWVFWDVRFNSKLNNEWQENFPGRWALFPNAKWRFSIIPYYVWPNNYGHYDMTTPMYQHWIFPPLCFRGGYTWFYEDIPDGKNDTHWLGSFGGILKSH